MVTDNAININHHAWTGICQDQKAISLAVSAKSDKIKASIGGIRVYKTKRRYNGEPVRPDPTVDPTENETGIYFTSADSNAWVSSYEPVVVERLLHHPNFKIEQLITMQIEKQECVVGVIGRLPIGAVRLGRVTAKDNHELIVQVPGFRPAKPVQANAQMGVSQAKRELPLNLPAKALKAKSPKRAKKRQQIKSKAKGRKRGPPKPSRTRAATVKGRAKTKTRLVKRKRRHTPAHPRGGSLRRGRR